MSKKRPGFSDEPHNDWWECDTKKSGEPVVLKISGYDQAGRVVMNTHVATKAALEDLAKFFKGS